MDNNYKEVYFGQYCRTCQYQDTEDSEDPCYECLNEPVNLDSHKPIKWEEK